MDGAKKARMVSEAGRLVGPPPVRLLRVNVDVRLEAGRLESEGIGMGEKVCKKKKGFHSSVGILSRIGAS